MLAGAGRACQTLCPLGPRFTQCAAGQLTATALLDCHSPWMLQ
jgi:hypothetical protein